MIIDGNTSNYSIPRSRTADKISTWMYLVTEIGLVTESGVNTAENGPLKNYILSTVRLEYT